jgi:MoaA/NifB/PqqE/SkfB family radical SAM enzyme
VLSKSKKAYDILYKYEKICELKYKEWLYPFRALTSFPEDIQVQTVTGCNAYCAFCPNGKTENPIPPGKMEGDLYRKIIDECVKKPVRRISPYLMNEPLCDSELGWKIKYITERKKNRLSIKLNTNASLLSGKLLEDILESGLDRLNISFHGISKEVYEKSMQGLEYEKTLANVNNVLEAKKQMNKEKPKITITMVKTKLIDSQIDDIKSYWGKRNVSIHIQPMENRANGYIRDKGLNPDNWETYSRCKRLFKQAYILYNGDMVLCCADWERTTILGNVKEKSIEEVWNGENAVSIRKKFLRKNTKGLLCHSCLRQPRQLI